MAEPRLADVEALWACEGRPDCIPCLALAIRDPNPVVRRVAARVLGTVRTEEAARLLAEALRDPDRAVRLNALIALQHVPDPGAAEAIFHIAVESQDREMARAAIRALGMIPGEQADGFLLEIVRRGAEIPRGTEKSQEAARALGERCGSASLRALMQIVSEADGSVLAESIWGIGRFGLPDTVPFLERAIQRQEPWRAAFVMEAVCLALENVGAPEAIPIVLEALNDAHRTVRTAAARALRSIAESCPKALSAHAGEIIRTMARPDSDTYDDILMDALLCLPEDAVTDAVLRCLGDDQPPELRRAAIGAAGKMIGRGNQAALAILSDLLLDRDQPVEVRRQAAIALSEGDPADVFPVLEAACQQQPKETELDCALGFAVGRVQDPRGEPLIRQFLQHRSQQVRTETCQGIITGRNPHAISPLLEILWDCQPEEVATVASALVAIGPAAAEALLDALRDREVGNAAAQVACMVLARPENLAVIATPQHLATVKKVPGLAERIQQVAEPLRPEWLAALL